MIENNHNQLSLEEEKSLINRAKNDKEAFGELYEIYFKRIYNYVLHRTSNVDLSEDLTSQTFMKVLENISKFEWRGLPFQAWLYRIASNVLMSHYRKNKHTSAVNMDDIQFLIVDKNDSPLEEIKKQENIDEIKVKFIEVQKAISKLKPKYAEIIALKFFEKKSNSEIAKIMDISEGNLRIRIFRALKTLKNYL